MEPSKDKPDFDQNTLIADFNAITQNENTAIALHYLEMSSYDMNKAISLFMENPPPIFSNVTTASSITNNIPNTNNDQIYGNAIFEQMAGFLQETNNNGNNLLTAQIKEYKLYLKDKEKQDAEFEFNVISNIYKTSTSAIKGIWNKIIPIAIRGETPGGEEFTCYFHKTYKKMKSYNFIHGNVFENIDYAHSKNRMLLIFIYSFEIESLQPLQKNLLSDEHLIKYINDNFIVLGLLHKKNETTLLKQKYPEINEFPCFVTFRKDLFDKPMIVDIIPINETHNEPSFYLEKLKNTQTKYHKLSQDEDLIKKKALREINLENQSKYFGYAGNQFFSFNDESYDYPYASPPQTRQQDPALQRKLEMDRMLKKQQEEEYKLAQMLAEEHTLRKQREIEEQQKQNEEKKHEEEEKVNLEKLKYETLQKKRAQLLPEPLPSEEELLEVLFRLPNGTKISRRFRKTENIDMLYTFIETLEGLSWKGQFDIIRTMPSLNLSDKKTNKIGEIFEDSTQELFHVREID